MGAKSKSFTLIDPQALSIKGVTSPSKGFGFSFKRCYFSFKWVDWSLIQIDWSLEEVDRTLKMVVDRSLKEVVDRISQRAGDSSVLMSRKFFGKLAEWPNALDSKSGIPITGIGGLNPSLSAEFGRVFALPFFCFYGLNDWFLSVYDFISFDMCTCLEK